MRVQVCVGRVPRGGVWQRFGRGPTAAVPWSPTDIWLAYITRDIDTCVVWQLEEGEGDTERGRQFSACFRRMHKKEQELRVQQQREEKQARKQEYYSQKS